MRVAARARDDELGVERQRRRTEVTGGVGVRQRAAEGAAVPDLRVRDLRDGLGQQQRVLLDQAVVDARRRAVVIAPITMASPSSRMPRSESMPPRSMTTSGALSRIRRTGSRLCPPAMIFASSPCSAERGEGLLDRGRCEVVELRGDHWPAPSVPG